MDHLKHFLLSNFKLGTLYQKQSQVLDEELFWNKTTKFSWQKDPSDMSETSLWGVAAELTRSVHIADVISDYLQRGRSIYVHWCDDEKINASVC